MLDQVAVFAGSYLLKIGFLILNGILIAFLIIIYQQATSMEKVIKDDGGSTLINLVSLANIFIAIAIFVAALILL